MLTKKEIVERSSALHALPDDAPVEAEFADLGEGGNVTSGIVDVIVEDGKIVLVTDHAI